MRAIKLGVMFVLLVARPTSAQTDEIQVYDASIAERGQFNLTANAKHWDASRFT